MYFSDCSIGASLPQNGENMLPFFPVNYSLLTKTVIMKKLMLILVCIISIKTFGQVTIPANYLKKSMQKIEERNSASALHDSSETSLKSKFYFLPTLENIDFFQNDTARFFQKNVVSYNDSVSNIALYSEIASDFIGPVRVSAGVTFTYPKTDTSSVTQQKINRDNFVQKFSTGGGTLVFNFILPVFSYNSSIFGTTMSFGPKFSIDPPSFGVTSGNFAHNTALGTDIQAELRGIKNVFKFYANSRLGYIAGNAAFYNALQLENNDRKGFWLNNYTIGVNVKDIFTLSYTKFWGSKNISDKLSGYLTFTVEPNFK